MHVAFLIAYDIRSPYQVSLPPLGIGYLCSWLKKNCLWAEVSFHHTIEELTEAKPDIVAISASSENFNDATKIARYAKEVLGVPTILGGMHITSIPTILPAVFDVGVVGEGEQVFVELMQLYKATKTPSASDFRKINGLVWHDGDQVVVNTSAELIKELDDLPYPDRDTIDRGWKVPSWETVHLISSRGCPYKCSFCSSSLHWKRFRFFTPEYVAKEIEYLRERYNPETLYFFDDLFVGHIGRWREVVKIFRERGIHKGVTFRAYARVDLITEQMADEFAELNFKYIDFGFESNSEKVLQFLTKTRVTPDVNQRAIDMLARNNLSVGANFIIGSPPENLDDLQETYDFAEHNREVIDRCSVGPLQPLPGTGVWHMAKAKGLVSDDMDWSTLGTSYDTFNFDTFPFMAENMTKSEFWGAWTKFNTLAKEINYVGQMRRLTAQRGQRDEQIRQLESQLATLKGSRLVQWAEKLRAIRRAISAA